MVVPRLSIVFSIFKVTSELKSNERAIRKLLQRREVTDGDDADFSANAELSARVQRSQSNRILLRVGLFKRERRKAMICKSSLPGLRRPEAMLVDTEAADL